MRTWYIKDNGIMLDVENSPKPGYEAFVEQKAYDELKQAFRIAQRSLELHQKTIVSLIQQINALKDNQ